MKVRFFVVMTLLFVLLLIPSSAFAQNELPAFDDLAEGWNTLEPGGETMCSVGTPYSFHVLPGSQDDVLVFFNGGGACWFGEACDVSVEPNIHVPVADTELNDPRDGNGIFDLDNDENPFLGYTMIFVSYCTGDVHLGAGPTTYEITAGDETREVTVFHNGYVNSMSALNWLFDNIDAPRQVAVMGSSAGSIASPFYAGIVAEQYPDARIVQLGDGAGSYRETVAPLIAWGTLEILPDWPEYEDETIETLSFVDFYVANTRFDNMVQAHYDSAEDETQYGFNAILGATDPLLELIELNRDEIRAEVDAFYTYTAGGPVHTILRGPWFYEYEVEGVRFVDWVTALLEGDMDMVEDIACDVESGECDVEPGAEMEAE